MQFDILAYQGDFDFPPAVFYTLQHLFPFGQITGRTRNGQFPAYNFRQAVLLQHQGRLVKNRQRQILYDAILFDVTE